MWKQNVESFLRKYLPYFQIALTAWQIFKFTPLAALIRGVMRRLLSLPFPGLFPAYERLQLCPGLLFKTVKCVVLTNTKVLSNTKVTNTPDRSETGVVGSQEFSKDTKFSSSSAAIASGSGETEVDSPAPSETLTVKYLGENFKVEWKKGKQLFVCEKMSYYISGRQWERICQMEKKCFKKEKADKNDKKEKAVKNEVVFVKGWKLIWEKVATGDVMKFEEVLDYVIFENASSVLISDDVWFLPVDLSEKSEGKLPKLLNLIGFIPGVSKAQYLVPTSLAIAAAVLEFCTPLRSRIYGIINKLFCGSVQYICNKLPYPGRKFVYLLFIWVDNLKPRNDIQLEVVERGYIDVVIGGAAKTYSNDATRVHWLDKEEDGAKKYEFRCGCSISIHATYTNGEKKCVATLKHTNAVVGDSEERVFVKCKNMEQFKKIGTFLSCVATSKAGSLLEYNYNDNKVHVRNWKDSLRHYQEAGFPEVYKLRLHRVIV